jgi:hypothetical protein
MPNCMPNCTPNSKFGHFGHQGIDLGKGRFGMQL